MKKIIIILLVVLIATISFYFYNKTIKEKGALSRETGQLQRNKFTLEGIKLGEKIAGMEIVRITQEDRSGEINADIEFRGRTTISGKYTVHGDDYLPNNT